MNSNLKAFLLTICLCGLAWSCGGNVEPPEIHGTDIRKTRTMSVSEFKRACWQEGTLDYSMPVKSDDGRQLAVEAVVVANGSNENLSGCLIAGDESAAIAIAADASTISADFPVGSKITIYPEGLHAGRTGTVFTLGCDSRLSPLGPDLLSEKLKLTGTETNRPVAMPLSRLDEKEAIFTWQNRLVMLEHVCVASQTESGFTLREANGATIMMLTGDNNNLCWDGNISGEGTVCGIISTRPYDDKIQWIILPRYGTDIIGFSPSVRPGNPEDPDTPDDPDNPSDTTDPDEDETTADFSTLNGGQTATGYSGRFVTMRGWETVNCAIASGGEHDNPAENAFTFIGSRAVKAPVLNGRIGGLGKITSPEIPGGVKRIEFHYGFPFEERNVKFTVNVLRDGLVEESCSVTVSDISSRRPYKFEWDVECDGAIVIEILNNGISRSSGDKDRMAVWHLKYEPKQAE